MKYVRSQAKEWVRDSLRDYLVTTTTPLNADLGLDEEGLRRNVDHILRFKGARGIYIGSIYQEFWTLTLEERKRLAKVTIDAVNGRVPVVVGVNASCIADIVALALHAQESGADLVMVWPPTFGQRSPEGVLAYYRAIAEKLDIGMCVYASALSEIGFQLTAPMLLELAKIDNICAVKEASMSIATYLRTVELVGKKVSVSSPLEEYWLFGRLMQPAQAPKFMLGTSRPLYLQTEKRPFLQDFLDAYTEQDMPSLNRALQNILSIANRLHNKYLQRGEHNVALTKAITGMFGMAAGPVRPPITMPSGEDIAEARSVLREAGLVP